MTTRYATLSGKMLCSPAEALHWARENRTPTDFWLKANSLSCPLGKEPGSAFVLMTRQDFAALDRNGLHSLAWVHEGGSTTFPSLVIVRADCMNLAYQSDPKSLYLVELADKRRLLRGAINKQYNVRVPAGPRGSAAEYYYPESLNSGSLWTWQTLLSDIWALLPGIAGSAPTLPYTPDGSPEGFRFIGADAWGAYNEVAEKIGCRVKYDPLTAEISMVRMGTTQSGLADSLAALAARQVFTFDPLDSPRAEIPATIRVFFHKLAEDGHGTEKDTPRTGNWEMSPAHYEDIPTGVTGAESGSVMPVWDDLPALVADDGTVTNTGALNTRATEVAANIKNRLNVSEEPYRTHFGGCVTTILPGSQVSKVVWRDFEDGEGLVTEVHRDAAELACGPGAGENLSPPDLARKSHPVYPNLPQIVQVYHSGGTAGETVSANADGYHSGRVKRLVGSMATLEDCWLRFVDEHDTNLGQVTAKDGDYFIGRLSGVGTSGGSTRPVYAARKGGEAPPWYLGITRETFTQGVDEFVEVDVYEWQVDKWRKITIPPDGFVKARDWFLNKDEVLEKKTKVRVDYYRTTWVVTAMYCSPTDLDELDDYLPPSPGELEQLANQLPFDGGGVMMPALGNGPDSGLVLFPDGDSETQNFPWFPNS